MNIITALQSEADPLIEAFDLSGTAPEAPFQIYRRDDIWLIISGPGLASASAVVAYLEGRYGECHRDRLWLNVGIAGHRDRSVGDAVVAGKVVDAGSGDAWYPQPVFQVEPDLGSVITVREPERSFDRSAAYDMEAAGYYTAAMRFTTVERAHVLKVISDGPERSHTDLDREQVRNLIAQHTDTVQTFYSASEEMTERDPYMEEVRNVKEDLIERAHYTRTQVRQLQELLERWKAVYPERDVREVCDVSSKQDADGILTMLSDLVESARVSFGEEP